MAKPNDVAAGGLPPSRHRPWWQTGWVAALAVFAVAVPLLWPAIPPLLDLPSHMASYHVSTALGRSANLARYFAFDWQILGNLGIDLLVVPLTHLFGVEPATKLAVLLVPTLTALGFLLLAWQAHGRLPATAFAALPLAYNYPLMFGFVNYCLAVAIAFIGFAWWLRLGQAERWATRAIAFALIAAACWLAHAIGWAMLALMCGVAELQRRLAARQPLPRLLAGTAVACLPLLSPLILMWLGPHETEATAYGWFQPFMIAKWTLTLLRDRWLVFDILSVLLIAGLLGAAVLRVWRLRFLPALGWPAAALALLYVAAPQSISGSFFVSARIVPYAAAMALLAIDTREVAPSRQRLLALACALFLAVRMAGNTLSFALYDASYRRELAALDHIPQGGAVLTLAGIACNSSFANWYNPRLYHIGGMAVVRRDAFVNATWGIAGLHVLRVHYPQAGAFQGDPSEMVYDGPCATGFAQDMHQVLRDAPWPAFDRLWLVNVPRSLWPHDPRLVPVWQAGTSAVFRIVGGPSGR